MRVVGEGFWVPFDELLGGFDEDEGGVLVFGGVFMPFFEFGGGGGEAGVAVGL